MRTTTFKDNPVTDADVIGAMQRFDAKRRTAFTRWKRYAVQYEGRDYPPKEILRMASGYVGGFPGGETTNRVFRQLGFNVIELDEDSVNADDDVEDALEITFKLEEDLERFLVKDLNQLENGLKLYNDSVRGQQMDAGPAGRIDILATDANNKFVVIELKAGEADRQVCGQIQAYMAWVSENLGEGKPARGILVAGDFTARCKLAAKVVPTLALKKYSVVFKFSDP